MRCTVVVPALALSLAVFAGCQPAKPPDQQAATAAGVGELSRPDQLLLAAAKVALPPAGLAPGDLPDPASREAQLVVTYCTQCHAMPAPSMHSATDWPSVARRMWLRMDWLPPSLGVKAPTSAERYTIMSYLLANALKVSGTTLPAGKGRDEFAMVCSQCHALPDPRVHSPGDWPIVYARMERNMERMQVKPPGGLTGTDIMLYLQSVASKRPAARD
jgi:cytochrome c5